MCIEDKSPVTEDIPIYSVIALIYYLFVHISFVSFLIFVDEERNQALFLFVCLEN